MDSVLDAWIGGVKGVLSIRVLAALIVPPLQRKPLLARAGVSRDRQSLMKHRRLKMNCRWVVNVFLRNRTLGRLAGGERATWPSVGS
jgi:hypothetical protein